MSTDTFDEKNRYLIENYDTAPPFTSFLPGIAGPMGIPLWVFYVNRGQAITSFGVETKDHPIMEFQPANKAYRHTAAGGFRTFLKIQRGDQRSTYEPFSPGAGGDPSRGMFVGMNELELVEKNPRQGLKAAVLYFTIPGENYAGLARRVVITNTGSEPVDLEILDGMPAVIPYGVNNFLLKELGRTVEAWMEVFNLDQKVPFYRVRASIEDKPQVETFEAGNFALAFRGDQQGTYPLEPFVDPDLLFGWDTAYTTPVEFYRRPLKELKRLEQIPTGKTPCAFFGSEAHLEPSESTAVYSIYGHMHDVEALNQQYRRWLGADYFTDRRSEANRLVEELTGVIDTQTSSPSFDRYCRQTFLDNVLRGGWPVLLGKKKVPYHIYSRKHGDPERDYNFFYLAASYYSQGNGNYRDVNQNRRCDVYFNPDIGAHNIQVFTSLLQADGYNPLVVEGGQFSLPEDRIPPLSALGDNPERIAALLSQPFSPGELLKTIQDHHITLKVSPQQFLALAVDQAEGQVVAEFGEGYWSDHWTYNLDLVESYLALYPEQKFALLFEGPLLPFYDSAWVVNPRDRKYCLTPQGPRQLNAVRLDSQKEALIASRLAAPHWLRIDHGKGVVYRANLMTKLVVLAVIKFATLDPWGMGVEMEAGKPGWYDALNGLPALFGSSMPETYELKRLLAFLLQATREWEEVEISLPEEVGGLLDAITEQLDIYHRSESAERDHLYWEAVASAREDYRQKIRLGFEGSERAVPASRLGARLGALLGKVDAGIQRALELNRGLPPTYFAYQVTAYDEIPHPEEAGSEEPDLIHFRARGFKPTPLPLFLEGVVRCMKISSKESSADLFKRVRASDLYDGELKMYKVNAPLQDQPHHIGRARAFTPGWLENESIWLHMEYKYLLEVLKAGLYGEFFQDFKRVLIPFQDPEVYRRSPLENSSFLVSSAHPDQSLHGAGFVARLSGSTAEFLSIWQTMMAGRRPFSLADGKLCLKFTPTLPGWLFSDAGTISFQFLGRCRVTYHNPARLDICAGAPEAARFILHGDFDQPVEFRGAALPEPHAGDVRLGRINQIEVFFST
jgi:hypothetical protein